MVANTLRFLGLLLTSLLVGTMFGIWLGFNPSALTAATYVEQQQNAIRALNTALPVLGAVCILLTAALAVYTKSDRRSRYLLMAAVAFLVVAGLITRFENQPINSLVMTWSAQAPATNWMALRDSWWNWHVLRTVAGICALSLTILAAVLSDRTPGQAVKIARLTHLTKRRKEKHVKVLLKAMLFVAIVWSASDTAIARGAPCLLVTLTGTQAGPTVFNGQAGAGTLVRYGDDGNYCGAVKLQFDTGRGTNMRLSQIGVSPVDLNAIFFTHTHSDHTEGLADILQLRWYFKGPKIDIVCSADAAASAGHVNSCRKYVTHVADAFSESGEIAERRSEDSERLAGGPAALADVTTFVAGDEVKRVWSSGDVRVSAIRSTHTAGHVSYRVDTPAGSVVIGGDASNDALVPPRAHSTSDQVERLAMGADVIVHSTTHPVLAPDRGSGFPALVYYRQSTTTDLGAMAKHTGAKYLMLTHLAPSLGAVRHNRWTVPGGALAEADYRKAAEDGGFTGTTIVGVDLVTLRLPAK